MCHPRENADRNIFVSLSKVLTMAVLATFFVLVYMAMDFFRLAINVFLISQSFESFFFRVPGEEPQRNVRCVP